VAHAVALALGTAWVRHFGECGKQESKWHGATSQNWKVASIQSLRPLATAHAQAATAELNGPDPKAKVCSPGESWMRRWGWRAILVLTTVAALVRAWQMWRGP